MSYRTPSMFQHDTAPKAISVSLTHPAHLPQILRQSNYLGTGDMQTANVNFRVKPHIESGAAAMPVPRELHELYPTQSAPRQQLSEHVDDWSKHAIVASVAGLQTKLAELDSEIRTGASADAGGTSVMRHVQDHANLLRENAKMLSETQGKHREVTGLVHKICNNIHENVQDHANLLRENAKMLSETQGKHREVTGLVHKICNNIHENVQQHSTSLQACHDDIGKLQKKQSSSVSLVHDICKELHNGLEEHAQHKQSLQHEVSLLQQKDVVAQALLSKMLTMLDQHESVVSNLKDGISSDHMSLLDSMCDVVEKTKTKVQGFEQTQQDMQRVIADFKAGNLQASGAYETEALQTKLDRYMRLSKDIDGQCSEALQRHGAKMEELQRTHQQALHEQRMKIEQLERAQQLALDEQQAKLQQLERKVMASQSEQRKFADLEGKVQELALHHLNSSQNASIARVAERDVKLLQHEMKQMHSLKKDVEAMHEATNNNVSSVQAELRRLQSDSKTRNEHSLMLHRDVEDVKSSVTKFAHAQQAGAVDKSIAEMHAKMLDLQRNQTLQSIRIDKTASLMHDMQCKLAA
jgi:myosin heavy subunit